MLDQWDHEIPARGKPKLKSALHTNHQDMIRPWALRESWLKVCWALHNGAAFVDGTRTSIVDVLRHDAGVLLACFEGRDGMPRWLASVTTAAIARFLGGVPRHVHGLPAGADRPVAAAVLPGGAAAVLVTNSGAVHVVRLSDGALVQTLPLDKATDVCVTQRGALYVSCFLNVYRLHSRDFSITGVMKGFPFEYANSVSADETVAVVQHGRATVVFENCGFVTAVPLKTADTMMCGFSPVVVPDDRCFAVLRGSWSEGRPRGDAEPDVWEFHVLSLTGELLRRILSTECVGGRFQLVFSSAGETAFIYDDTMVCHDADAAEVPVYWPPSPTHDSMSWLFMRSYFAVSDGRPYRLACATLHHDALHIVSVFDDEDYARWRAK